MKEFKVKPKPFFYDAQIKRYLMQIAGQAFAGWQVESGLQRDGQKRRKTMPVIVATYDRVVGYLQGGGNMNTVPTLPILSVEIAKLSQKSDRRRNPSHSERYYYEERNPHPKLEGDMSVEAGDTSEAYLPKVIERYMPVPYELSLIVSVWASNSDQSYQITEQLGTHFNDELDIIISNSPADWTGLTTLRFDGDIDFRRTGKDIGGGTGEDDFHVIDLSFTTTIYLNPPVKVFNSDAIKEIHVQIMEADSQVEDWSSHDLIDGFIIKGDD